MEVPSEKPNGLGLGVDSALYAPHPAVVNTPPQMRGYLNHDLVKDG